MSVRDCDYQHTEAGFLELRDFLMETYRLTGRPDNWFFGRLEDWKYGGNSRRARSDPQFFTRNVHLWRNEAGRLAGFCICEYGGNDIELQVHPDYRDIEAEMLEWIETVWAREHSTVEILAEFQDPRRGELLLRRGYEDAGDDGYTRQYDLSRPYPDPILPEGFRIVTLAEDRNDESHVAAVRAAFGRATLDMEWFESKCTAPGYSREWDLAVVAPDGMHAAFCLAWLDRRNGMAEIDPVGTHPEFQRRGLGKAVVTECFRRLHGAGIRYGYIGSAPEPYVANRLYESLQPVARYQSNRWVKKLR